MSFEKYKRLCIVLVFPLLLAGYVFSTYVAPSSSGKWILCNSHQLFGNNCRLAGDPDGDFYKSIYDGSERWADVSGTIFKNNFLSYYIQADNRNIGTATISDVKSFLDFPGVRVNSPEIMETFINKRAYITLTSGSGTNSTILSDGSLHLNCNGIDFDTITASGLIKMRYTLSCYDSNLWAGKITISPDPAAEDNLEIIRVAVNDEIAASERVFIQDRVIATLLPLALFLIISMLAWLVLRAVKYVRAG